MESFEEGFSEKRITKLIKYQDYVQSDEQLLDLLI